jgi:hypothetical protein
MVDTTALTSALDSTKNLQETCKGLSTDDCAKKQAQLQADTDAAQLKFFKDTLAAQITLLTKQRDKIQTQYDAIKAEKTAALQKGALVFKADSVFPTYDEILTRINTDITTLTTSVPYIVSSTEGFQDSTKSGSAVAVRPPYVIPTVTLPTDYDIEHEKILATYNSLMGNPYDLNRMLRNLKTFIYRRLVPIAFYITLAFSVIWGGILCSNMYVEAEQDFLAARIWYFLHGMIGFPAVLAWSLYKPPYWVSGVFPLYARAVAEETEDETSDEQNSGEQNSGEQNSGEQNSGEQNSTEQNFTEEETVEDTSGTEV